MKGTVVGYTDEVGVQLPPLHPRCRCAIDYREVGELPLTSPRRNANVGGGSKPNERAIVYDNGLRNDYTVNFKLMNSKAYHDRFETLTSRKATNEALYKQAVKILGHRNGGEFEDLIILDARTGKLLVENLTASGMFKFQCGLTREQNDYLEKLGVQFEALHNHPNNSYPSPSDIVALFSRKLQIASTVVCHDGTIYRLEKLRSFEAIKDLTGTIRQSASEQFNGYPAHLIETKAAQALVKELARLGALRFKEAH